MEPGDGRWKLVPGTSVHLLAEHFGRPEQVRTQVGRHRGAPAAYRRALRIVDHHPEATSVLGTVEEAEAYLWPPEPPPEDGKTVMDLLQPGSSALT